MRNHALHRARTNQRLEDYSEPDSKGKVATLSLAERRSARRRRIGAPYRQWPDGANRTATPVRMEYHYTTNDEVLLVLKGCHALRQRQSTLVRTTHR